jgi:hypothetical protein
MPEARATVPHQTVICWRSTETWQVNELMGQCLERRTQRLACGSPHVTKASDLKQIRIVNRPDSVNEPKRRLRSNFATKHCWTPLAPVKVSAAVKSAVWIENEEGPGKNRNENNGDNKVYDATASGSRSVQKECKRACHDEREYAKLPSRIVNGIRNHRWAIHDWKAKEQSE